MKFSLVHINVWLKSALLKIVLLLFILGSGCTIYKRADYNNTERIVSEDPVKIRSILLKNNEIITIDRSVALVEANKDYITIRYFTGDSLVIQSSEIRSVRVQNINKSATVGVNSAIITVYVAFGVLGIIALGYGLYYLLTLGQGF